jgi:hypothetical protein
MDRDFLHSSQTGCEATQPAIKSVALSEEVSLETNGEDSESDHSATSSAKVRSASTPVSRRRRRVVLN